MWICSWLHPCDGEGQGSGSDSAVTKRGQDQTRRVQGLEALPELRGHGAEVSLIGAAKPRA